MLLRVRRKVTGHVPTNNAYFSKRLKIQSVVYVNGILVIQYVWCYSLWSSENVCWVCNRSRVSIAWQKSPHWCRNAAMNWFWKSILKFCVADGGVVWPRIWFGFYKNLTFHALGMVNLRIRPKPSSFKDSVALAYSASAMALADCFPCLKLR